MTASPTFSTLNDYLAEFAPEMSERIEQGYVPLFDPTKDALSEAVLGCSTEVMAPFPPQAAVLEAGARYLMSNRDLTVSGEMGTGKTPMGVWFAKVLAAIQGRHLRVVVTCPNHLVYKWRDHFNRLLPEAKTEIIGDFKALLALSNLRQTIRKVVTHKDGSVSESIVHRWRKPTQTEVYILPRDKGKLGYAWRAAPIARGRLAIDFRCPKCGTRVLDSAGHGVQLSAFVTPLGNLRSKRTCTAIINENNPRKNKARNTTSAGGFVCGEPLWQAHNGTLGPFSYEGLPTPGVSPHRVAPCVLLRRMGFRFDLYIPDEVHELKGGGSLQGQMFADLCSLSKKIICMTGTLVGGYADNLEHILWRTNAGDMVADGQRYSEEGHQGFVRDYGVLRVTKKYKGDQKETEQDLTLGRGKVASGTAKSLPGINPILFTNLLCGKTVFLRLADMHAHLPKFEERVHTLPMDHDDDVLFAKMHEEYAAHRAQVRPSKAGGAARAAFMRWPDKPWVDPYWIMDRDRDGHPIRAFFVPSQAQRERPKERRLRRLIQRNMARGRKTWVFSELTGRNQTPAWDWTSWFATYLGKFGIRAAVLRSTGNGGPKPEDREAWIAKTSPNVDVVISNPSLVKTGLDLYDFPSIIFAFTGENLYTLRQACRRAWRLGQTETCEVDYLLYRSKKAKSVQEAAMSLMAKKMAASLAIEGDFSGDGLAAMVGDGDDVATQLARFIDGNLAVESAADAFAKYREKFAAVASQLGTALTPKIRHPAPPLEREPILLEPIQATPEVAIADAMAAVVAEEKRHADRVNEVVRAMLAPDPVPALPEAPQVVVAPAAPPPPPSAKANRRAERLAALTAAIGCSATQRDGDWFLVDGRWYSLISRRPNSPNDPSANAFLSAHPDGYLAYAEPASEAGPAIKPIPVDVGGTPYLVAFLPILKYIEGGRVPGPIQ